MIMELNEMFIFPIVMIDGNRERKRMEGLSSLALENSFTTEFVISEAAAPYYDFLGYTKKWLPTEESYERAEKGEFDGCLVTFGSMGTYLCTWPVEEFLEKLEEFGKKREAETEKLMEEKVIKITMEDLIGALEEAGFIKTKGDSDGSESR